MKKMAQSAINSRTALLRLEVHNFLGIRHLLMEEIPKYNRWIFLTGENGYGKTTVLQAIAMGVYGQMENHTVQGPNEKKFKISTLLLFNGKEVPLTLVPGQGWPSSYDAGIGDRVACYGASRLNINRSESDETASPTIGLFSTTTFLQNIEHSLSRWFLKKDDPEFKSKYENTVTLLKKLIPSLSEIRIDRNDKITYVERDEMGENYEPLPFLSLASGYRSLIAMIGDLLLRLYQTQPGVADPAELNGIVLIDEIDLHFHPNIQRRLPSLLSEIFPKVQFIASTHSPIPILGAPADSMFFRTMRTRDEGIFLKKLNHIEVKNLTPNTILTSPIFGFTDIISEANDGKTRIRTEETWADKELNDAVQTRLKAFAGETENEFDGLFGPGYKPGKVG